MDDFLSFAVLFGKILLFMAVFSAVIGFGLMYAELLMFENKLEILGQHGVDAEYTQQLIKGLN